MLWTRTEAGAAQRGWAEVVGVTSTPDMEHETQPYPSQGLLGPCWAAARGEALSPLQSRRRQRGEVGMGLKASLALGTHTRHPSRPGRPPDKGACVTPTCQEVAFGRE